MHDHRTDDGEPELAPMSWRESEKQRILGWIRKSRDDAKGGDERLQQQRKDRNENGDDAFRRVTAEKTQDIQHLRHELADMRAEMSALSADLRVGRITRDACVDRMMYLEARSAKWA